MLVELGLTEDQFFRLTPAQTFLRQLQNTRKAERIWIHTRELWAAIYNATRRKQKVKPQNLIKLSFDKPVKYEKWTREDATELINAWSSKN